MRSDSGAGPLPRGKCAELFEQVAGAARALGIDDVEAIVASGSSALTRFANNAIHQNVAERTSQLFMPPR